MKEDIVEFLDTYEGEIMFTNEDFKEIVEALENNVQNKVLIDSLCDKLIEISDVFLSSPQTQQVTPIFLKLSTFLQTLDDEAIQNLNQEIKEYLILVINDIVDSIDTFFIDRIFDDVYVFEHSLESNIQFIKHKYENRSNKDDGSSVEFF